MIPHFHAIAQEITGASSVLAALVGWRIAARLSTSSYVQYSSAGYAPVGLALRMLRALFLHGLYQISSGLVGDSGWAYWPILDIVLLTALILAGAEAFLYTLRNKSRIREAVSQMLAYTFETGEMIKEADRLRSVAELERNVLVAMTGLMRDDIFWLVDKDDIITHSVGGALARVGIAPGEVVGQNISRYLSEEQMKLYTDVRDGRLPEAYYRREPGKSIRYPDDMNDWKVSLLPVDADIKPLYNPATGQIDGVLFHAHLLSEAAVAAGERTYIARMLADYGLQASSSSKLARTPTGPYDPAAVTMTSPWQAHR